MCIGLLLATFLCITMVEYTLSIQCYLKKLCQEVYEDKISKTVIKAVYYIHIKIISIIFIQAFHHTLIQAFHRTLIQSCHHTLFFCVYVWMYGTGLRIGRHTIVLWLGVLCHCGGVLFFPYCTYSPIYAPYEFAHHPNIPYLGYLHRPQSSIISFSVSQNLLPYDLLPHYSSNMC